jgi:hypothetical protein
MKQRTISLTCAVQGRRRNELPQPRVRGNRPRLVHDDYGFGEPGDPRFKQLGFSDLVGVVKLPMSALQGAPKEILAHEVKKLFEIEDKLCLETAEKLLENVNFTGQEKTPC